MSFPRPPLLLSPGAAPGVAIILRPDDGAPPRGEVGSPAHLAAQADALFARMMARCAAEPAAPGKAEAALAALAAASLDTFEKIHGADPTLSAAADALRALGGVVREMAVEPAVRPDEDRGRGVPAHLVGRAVVFH